MAAWKESYLKDHALKLEERQGRCLPQSEVYDVTSLIIETTIMKKQMK